MNFKITTDNQGQVFKPSDEAGKISQRIKHIVETDVNGLADMLANGFSWTPAVLDGKGRKKTNWVSQQVFALDFDNKKTIIVDCKKTEIITKITP